MQAIIIEDSLDILPFETLDWERYQLCCADVMSTRLEVADCRVFLKQGYQQQGIDVYSVHERDKKKSVAQCKWKGKLYPKEIDTMVKKFLQGNLVDKVNEFILCTTYDLNTEKGEEAIERARVVLKERGIELLVWDKSGMSRYLRLHPYPNIVYRYFKEQVAKAFYGSLRQEYGTHHAVNVTFDNGSYQIIRTPKFRKTIIAYREGKAPGIEPCAYHYFTAITECPNKPVMPEYMNHCINDSYFPVRITLANTGSAPLHEFLVRLDFAGTIMGIAENNVSGGLLAYGERSSTNYTVANDGKRIKILPAKPLLVAGDDFSSDTFYLKADPQEKKIIINWTLLSNNFSTGGTLEIDLQPIIEEEQITVTVENWGNKKMSQEATGIIALGTDVHSYHPGKTTPSGNTTSYSFLGNKSTFQEHSGIPYIFNLQGGLDSSLYQIKTDNKLKIVAVSRVL